MIRTLIMISVLTGALNAQQRVSPGLTYHRVLAVSPLVGTGKSGDVKRPVFISATPSAANDRSGVLGYQMQLSDDGQSALVEYVFTSPAAFQAVLQKEAAARGVAVAAPTQSISGTASPGTQTNSSSSAGPSPTQTALEAAVPGLKMFERGKSTEAQVLAEFMKHKANFSLANFHPLTVQ
jgi:hypothetical protein